MYDNSKLSRQLLLVLSNPLQMTVNNVLTYVCSHVF